MANSILIGTANQGKFAEFEALFTELPYQLISLENVEINEVVEETGSTFWENAIIKAEHYSKLSGRLTIADDSGLEVDILGGEPGVFSARYAGEDATDNQNVNFLLNRLKRFKRPWIARFRCVIAIAHPNLDTRTFDGICEGEVIPKILGQNGFGYDPIFWIHQLNQTLAQLSSEEKNSISHRGLAALKVQEFLLTCSKIDNRLF
jgi:XTP/dITP diphosphohydrolase